MIPLVNNESVIAVHPSGWVTEWRHEVAKDLLTKEEILEAVCKTMHIGIPIVKSRIKEAKVAEARLLYLYYAHQLTTAIYKDINGLVKRNWTAHIYAINRIDNLLSVKDEEMMRNVEKVTNILKQMMREKVQG